jgi:hypothetical protein
MRTATAQIYTNGNTEEAESVLFEYEFIVIKGIVYINYVQLKLKLFGKADFLQEDIELAVAEDLGKRNPSIVRLDCEVQEVKGLEYKVA